jgi:hypothetical protein
MIYIKTKMRRTPDKCTKCAMYIPKTACDPIYIVPRPSCSVGHTTRYPRILFDWDLPKPDWCPLTEVEK